MFRFILLTVCASVFSLAFTPGAYCQERDHHLGEWSGTWHGTDASGHFDLDLQRESNGDVAGNIVVSTDSGKASEFAVDLRHVSFEGDTFTAVFVTPGKSPEVIKLTGSLSEQTGYGEWIAHKRRGAAGESTEADAETNGTWTLERHDSK
jgi:hypothetical protein